VICITNHQPQVQMLIIQLKRHIDPQFNRQQQKSTNLHALVVDEAAIDHHFLHMFVA
jgi:hypothetical protein